MVGKILDIKDRLLAKRAADLIKGFAPTMPELTRQDIIIVLSCEPMFTFEEIAEQLNDDFNPATARQVQVQLKRLESEGFIEWKDGTGWVLLPPAQKAVDDFVRVGDR